MLQQLYNAVDVRIRLAGLTVNLLDIDMAGQRAVELVGLTLDGLDVVKQGGKDGAELILHHLQIDDFRHGTTMPVILQPAYSGK